MVDVENLSEGESPQAQALSNKGALEVAHARLAPKDAPVEHIDASGCQSVDTSRDEVGMVCLVEESRDAAIVGHPYVQGFLVVDKVGDAHQRIDIVGLTEGADIATKLFFAENSVYGVSTNCPSVRKGLMA